MQPVISRIRLLAIYAVVLLPFIAYGAIHALQSTNTSPIDWVDSTFIERKHYDEFVELFGPGHIVIASWPECYWEDERLDVLTDGLRDSQTFRAADGAPFFHEVVSGRTMLLNMTKPAEVSPDSASASPADIANEQPATQSDERPGGPGRTSLNLPLELAIQRLQGTLIGPDGKTTCVIARLNDAGLDSRALIVQNIRKAIRVCCDVSDEDIHMAGPVIDGLTVDEASQKSLKNFALPSSIVIFLICWISLRSIISGAVVFLTASFCQASLLAVIYFTGERLGALLIILPPLVQVLTVSGGIHLMNYYLNGLRHLSPQDAAVDAFRKGWLPTVLSMGTTAMGTASLMVSGLQPIRLFGIYGTIGVLLTSATVLTVIPCSMILFGRRSHKRFQPDSTHSPHQSMNQIATSTESNLSVVEKDVSRVWMKLASFLTHQNSFALTVLLGIMVTGAIGLPRLKTSIRIETLFGDESRVMQDYRWMESHLGPLVPIEVLLQFDEECRLNDRLKMDLLWRVNETLLNNSHVQSTTSALTVFPPLPPMSSLPSNMRAAMINKAVVLAKPSFRKMGVLKENQNGEIWRITGHVSALEPLDYGDILKSVQTNLEAEILSNQDAPIGVSVLTSGIMPLIHEIQGQLLSDLFNSLVAALFVITVTMTIVEAGILSGIIAMACNVFPIVVAFGWMGLLQHPMDIGAVMTASVALGIAVDDTLHFLAFFRRCINQPGATRYSAVLSAYHHCGPAMIQTSLSCGIGLLVFAFSDFVPTSRFAMLMAFLLFLALLGDLLLLPALLLSPAGKLFQPEEQMQATT